MYRRNIAAAAAVLFLSSAVGISAYAAPQKDNSATEAETETETETENTEMNDAKEETGISEVEPETGSEETGVQAAAETAMEQEEPVREVFTGYSESDYNVLLRIVQAEAGNCDIEGRVMVANVILNRVEDDAFPNTITKVVYQKHHDQIRGI